jgi:copper(I)-binding protein
VISQEPRTAHTGSASPAGAAPASPPTSALTELLRGALAPVICGAVLLGLLSLWVISGGAGTINHVSIDITSASVATPAQAGGPGLGYLSVANLGSADRLISATTPDARRVEFVEHEIGGGGPKRVLGDLAIPAHATVSLNPFTTDIVLVGCKSLTPGQTMPLTLRFANAGEITVQAAITPPDTP